MQNHFVLINLNASRTEVDRLSLNSRNLVKHSHATVFNDGPAGQ
jgi:hypothetical protein